MTIHVRERKRRPPRGLARLAIEAGSRFAEEMRVYASDEDLARMVLPPEMCRVLLGVDEYDRYDFAVQRGKVLVRRSDLEGEAARLARAMRAASRLAARPGEITAQWAALARAVDGHRPESARWRLTASDPIIATRHAVAVTIRSHVASPGGSVEPRLYTEYTCAPRDPATPFVLYAHDWDGPLPRDVQPAALPRDLAFLAQRFMLARPRTGDLDDTRWQPGALRPLMRSQARFAIVDVDRISIWAPDLVLDADATEAALRAAVALAGAGALMPYR